ncbi:MAG TPA: NifU family protein [Lacipirellulaceae bacterium]|jgi:Fe-S cluster biogenesis protein NfuA|nr:NifU family protein [Lacipirellulaceae bacterium]
MQTADNILPGLERIESLLESADDLGDCAETVKAVVQDLLDYHRAAITQMLSVASDVDRGEVLRRWAEDELIASVLLLYDLHPDDLRTRVERALEQARPYLQSHGGDVVLVSIDDGVVQLRMKGSCHGCPSSAMTLKNTIDKAICAIAPDAVAVHIADTTDDSPPATGFVPIDALFGMKGTASV